MRFVWDDRKNRRNRIKHKLSFEAAQLVFTDPFALNILDRAVDREERWQTIGSIAGVVVVLVVHTIAQEDGEEVIRIISARKATRQERRTYETQGHKAD